jgi:tRNA (adenine22-N1)-methyltransferase
MQLSRRLKAVADSVTKGNRVADVGCDHAYISIYLIRNDIAPYVIAMDVNKGPLSRAEENIKRKKYEDRIETRLSNGLEKMIPGEADTILLAGMGGVLMIKILEEGKEVVASAKELVLQPQSEIPLVRKYIHSIGYQIKEEQILIDEGKYYVVIKAIKEDNIETYEKEVFYQYGKLLLEEGSNYLLEYLHNEKRMKTEVIIALKDNSSEKALKRLQEILIEIMYIEEAIAYCS